MRGRNSQLPSDDMKFRWQGSMPPQSWRVRGILIGGPRLLSHIWGQKKCLKVNFFMSKLRAKVPGAFLRASELDTTMFPSNGAQVKREEGRGQDYLK